MSEVPYTPPDQFREYQPQREAPRPQQEGYSASASPETPSKYTIADYLREKIQDAKVRLAGERRKEKQREWVEEIAGRVLGDLGDQAAQLRQFAKEQFNIPETPAPKKPIEEKASKYSLKQYYEAKVAQLEAMQEGGNTEALRDMVETDLATQIERYSEEGAHVADLKTIERFDYAKSDDELIAGIKQELNSLTGQSEPEQNRRASLLADMQHIRVNPERMKLCRDIHNQAVMRREETGRKITQLFQLREELQPKSPAPSSNIPVDVAS